MAGRKRIGLREVGGLSPGQELWDAAVPGFGIRRQRSSAISYVLLFRTKDGRSRRYTIGRHGAPWTPDTARAKARELLGDVERGADPGAEKVARRSAATVGELCDLYLKEVEAGRLLTRRGSSKKASTVATDRSRIEAHIRPLLGTMKAPSVTREDIEAFQHQVASGATVRRVTADRPRGQGNVRGGKGAASRTIGLLGAIFSFAVRKRIRGDNPVRGVVRHADGRRERRLSNEEYALLRAGMEAVAVPKPRKTPRKPGQATAGGMWPPAIAVTKFLALTGWRSGEALHLIWQHVDLERRTARLPDTKTGLSLRPLSRAACALLAAQGRGKAGELVFPPTRGKGVMSGFPSLFARIAAAGGLPSDITPHVLRHSFSSVAGDMDYAETTIAALVGHQGRSMTSRYIHAADSVLLAAADAVANKIVTLMGEPAEPSAVIPMRAGERA